MGQRGEGRERARKERGGAVWAVGGEQVDQEPLMVTQALRNAGQGARASRADFLQRLHQLMPDTSIEELSEHEAWHQRVRLLRLRRADLAAGEQTPLCHLRLEIRKGGEV